MYHVDFLGTVFSPEEYAAEVKPVIQVPMVTAGPQLQPCCSMDHSHGPSTSTSQSLDPAPKVSVLKLPCKAKHVGSVSSNRNHSGKSKKVVKIENVGAGDNSQALDLSMSAQTGMDIISMAGSCGDIGSSQVSDQIETVNENGEKVVVQHYLLTSITTNTSTGKQTNQLITTPILIPNTEVTADGMKPTQLVTNLYTNQTSVPSEEAVPVLTCTLGDTAGPTDPGFEFDSMQTEQEHTHDQSSDKINITFIQRDDNEEETIHVDSIPTESDIAEFDFQQSPYIDPCAQLIHSEHSTAMDPHCRDRCADYSTVVGDNKEFMLSNPVMDDLALQGEMADNASSGENSVELELSAAASQELLDTLSNI